MITTSVMTVDKNSVSGIPGAPTGGGPGNPGTFGPEGGGLTSRFCVYCIIIHDDNAATPIAANL